MKKSLTTILIILGTILLAAIAIFIALRSYQTRNAKQSRPNAAAILALHLINADTNQPIPGFDPLVNGAVLNLSTLPANFAIYTLASDTTTASVNFNLNNGAYTHFENFTPYCIAGKTNNLCNAWHPTVGSYTLTVTPYTAAGATGTAGSPITINFTVINGTQLNCSLSFVLATPTPSPSPVPTPSPSPVPTPTPSPVPQCGTSCTSNANCLTGQVCSSGFCRNPNCVSSASCICPTITPSPSPIPTPSPSPIPTPSPSPVPQCGSSCSFDSNCLTGMVCSNGACRNPACVGSASCICPTITPSPSPSPTPNYIASCTNVRAYDLNWNPLTTTQLAALTAGSQVYFTVFGTTTPGTFDKARFTINGVLQPEVTTQKPGSPGEFYMIYTIPTGVTSFNVTGQVHQAELNQWF